MNYVVCLKYGDKYPASYVNKLYNMVERNLTIDFEFICITEDTSLLNPSITVLDLEIDHSIPKGWWYKINLFDPDFPIKGTILFIDLDVVICGDLNRFFELNKSEFVISRNYHKGHPCKINSSCFRMETGTYSNVYEDYQKNKTAILKKFAGDQDWIFQVIKDYKVWPREWIKSYKWEMTNENNDDTSIAVFHGNPNPHEINSNWINENWR